MIASTGNLLFSSLVSCSATTSGAAAPSHWMRCGRRTLSELTFQDATFIVWASELDSRVTLVRLRALSATAPGQDLPTFVLQPAPGSANFRKKTDAAGRAQMACRGSARTRREIPSTDVALLMRCLQPRHEIDENSPHRATSHIANPGT